MDPFSAAATVAGLVLLTYQCAQEIDLLIQEIQNLPDELSKLATQIQLLSAALSDFREFFTKRVIGPQTAPADGERPSFMPNKKWMENMEKLLTSLVRTIRDLERILREVKAKTNKFSRHWKWQTIKVEVGSLQRDLDRNVQTLLVMMSTFTSMSDAYLREEVHHISTQISASNKAPDITVTERPAAPIFKMPSFPRTNSSFALLSSFPSFSLFRTDTAKSDQAKSDLAEGTQAAVPEPPPPYAPVIEAKPHLVWVAGCYHHGEERFCAVIRPSAMSTVFHYSRDSPDMQTKFNDAVSQGLKMSSVNVHAAQDGSLRYCHMYVKPATERDQMPWYAAWDLDLGSFVAKNMDMTRAGYACVHLDACGLPGVGTLFAGIWEKPPTNSPVQSEVVHSVTQKELTAMYSHYCNNATTGEDKGYRNSSGTCAYEDGTGYIKFATVLVNRGNAAMARQPQLTKHLLTRVELERQMVEQRSGGYQVISVNPFILTGQEFFNCTWQKLNGSATSKAYVGISKETLEKVDRERAQDM